MFSVQTQFVDSMFVMHDGFGILFTMSMMTVPFFDSVVQRYLLHYPQDLCYPLIAASVISFGICLFCNLCVIATAFVSCKQNSTCQMFLCLQFCLLVFLL